MNTSCPIAAIRPRLLQLLLRLTEMQGGHSECGGGQSSTRLIFARLAALGDDGERNDQRGESKGQQAQSRWRRDCRLLDSSPICMTTALRAQCIADRVSGRGPPKSRQARTARP